MPQGRIQVAGKCIHRLAPGTVFWRFGRPLDDARNVAVRSANPAQEPHAGFDPGSGSRLHIAPNEARAAVNQRAGAILFSQQLQCDFTRATKLAFKIGRGGKREHRRQAQSLRIDQTGQLGQPIAGKRVRNSRRAIAAKGDAQPSTTIPCFSKQIRA